MSSAEHPVGEGQVRARGERRDRPVVVLGTIGHDAHIVGSSVVRFALEESGFTVVFLGALVPAEEFIAAAKESAADAILVSSMYGMARIDCEDFGAKCEEAGLGHVKRYLGGILVTDPEEWPDTEKLFKSYGFHRVYPPQTKPEAAIFDLKQDLFGEQSDP